MKKFLLFLAEAQRPTSNAMIGLKNKTNAYFQENEIKMKEVEKFRYSQKKNKG